MIFDNDWTVDRGEDVADLLLHEIAEAFSRFAIGS